MSGAPPPLLAVAVSSGGKAGARRRASNSRLGVVPAAPTLPPIDSPRDSPGRAPLAWQQADERAALEEQFAARVRLQKQLSDAPRLAQTVAAALDAEPDPLAEDDDAFALAERLVRAIDAKCPHAAQLLSLLVRETRELVQAKLRSEAERCSSRSKRVSSPVATPEPTVPNNSSSGEGDSTGDEGGEDSGEKSGSGSQALASPRTRPEANRRRFRTTLRSRRFPPTRVPDSERVTAKSGYMPFTHHRPGAVASGELRIDTESNLTDAHSLMESGSDGAEDALGGPQWTVVLFPRVRPSLSREEIAAFISWAQKTLGPVETSERSVDQSHSHDSNAAATAAERFLDQIAARELVVYELSRLVFDKCPTTARFLHGLFVELQELAARTLATADKEARVLDQRYRNALLEQQKLDARRQAVESSLTVLQDTMKRRQQQLLTERERTIRQRKKLNVLLAADQVVIRRVVGLLQHGIECADELLTAVRDRSEGNSGSPLASASLTAGILPSPARYSAVQDLLELVATKYAALPEVQQAKRERGHVGASRHDYTGDRGGLDGDNDAANIDSGGVSKRQVVVLDTDSVVVAADELRAAQGRLSRLLTAKCPDSGVGWAAEEMWDQALFIPTPEDVQDISRDIQRLCAHVEEFVLHERRRRQLRLHDGGQAHRATQTELTTCGPGLLRGRQRANGFLSAHTALPASASAVLMLNIDMDSYSNGVLSNEDSRTQPTAPHSRQRRVPATAPSTEHVLGILSSGQACVSPSVGNEPSATTRLALLRESNSELLSKFLPKGLKPFIHSIPVDYEPRQLSLTVVHAVISYVLNEMWTLIQQENLHGMSANNITRRFGSVASSQTPILVHSAHEYLYRIYLEHFQTPSFAVCRLLDLLVSVSRLDTQSCKVLLFCRLLELPGMDPLPPDSLWFLLKALHVLQRACIGSGNYFLLDAHGVNEFVPQASAWEALAQLFHGAGNDVTKRMRMRLAGLASVYGAVWIPAYNVMELVVEECTTRQATLRSALEEIMSTCRGANECGDSRAHGDVPTFTEFFKAFETLNLRVNRMDAAQAYRQLLSNAQRVRGIDQSHGFAASNGDASSFDPVRFNDQWLNMMLAAVNRAQHQQYQNPQAYAASRRNSDNSSVGGAGATIHFGAPCEALVIANRSLSRRFLRATWEQTKPDFIRWLDLAFHDIGLQVRLIQQMDSICESSELAVTQAWRGFQQLIQIVALGGSGS